MTAIADTKDRVRHWLFDQALPLWATAGVAADRRFEERLFLDGTPDADAPRRTRVQARQIFVFCEAAELGWNGPAREVAQAAFDRLVELCQHPRPGRWLEVIDAGGRVADDGADLYTHAFVLFALAAAHRTLKDPRALPLALQTLEFLNADMADPVNGGWVEALPPVLPRRQNPHMHLLEAMLAWRALTDEPAFQNTADAILSLFETRLYDPATGTLGEFFTQDWRIDPAEGDVTEPGHHAEWVWLLGEARRLGVADRSDIMAVLYQRAVSTGLDDQGRVVEQVSRAGEVREPGRRLWGQGEMIRAHLTMGHPEKAAALAVALLDSHLVAPTPGLWIDRLTVDNEPLNTLAPASSLYHLTTAFSELLRSPS